jgi:methionine-rich copper-binding protein CopC
MSNYIVWISLALLVIVIFYKYSAKKHKTKRKSKKHNNHFNKNLKKSVKLHFSRELEEEIEQKLEEEQNLVTKMTRDLPIAQQDLQESRIVKILRPFGFFTNLIFSERAELLKAQLEMEKEKGGYWLKLVKAQKKVSRGITHKR